MTAILSAQYAELYIWYVLSMISSYRICTEFLEWGVETKCVPDDLREGVSQSEVSRTSLSCIGAAFHRSMMIMAIQIG